MKNTCYTYFRITGKFDPQEITARLGLRPDRTHRIGKRRRDGTAYDFSAWEFGRCDDYDPLVENQMHRTIAPLLGKLRELNAIREEYDARLTLQIVPTLYAENAAPCLAPSMEIIDFCHATRTVPDIDLYLPEEE